MVEVKISGWNVREKEVLSDIAFNIKQKEILGLVGENGAGKSSVMKIITGLITDYKGTIQYNEKEIYNQKVFAAFIEEPKFNLAMTGIDNLNYFSGFAEKQWEERIRNLIVEWGMESYLEKKVKGYSLGMKQKLGLLIMFMFDRPFYIIDEPTNGLDDFSRQTLFQYIKELSENGKGILISSHNLNEINEVCNRVIMIHKGKVEDEDYKFKKIVTIKCNEKIENIEEKFKVVSQEGEYIKLLYTGEFLKKIAELQEEHPMIELHAVNNYYENKGER